MISRVQRVYIITNNKFISITRSRLSRKRLVHCALVSKPAFGDISGGDPPIPPSKQVVPFNGDNGKSKNDLFPAWMLPILAWMFALYGSTIFASISLLKVVLGINTLDKSIDKLDSKVDELNPKIDKVVTELNTKIDNTDTKIDRVSSELRAEIKQGFDKVDGKLDRMNITMLIAFVVAIALNKK